MSKSILVYLKEYFEAMDDKRGVGTDVMTRTGFDAGASRMWM